MASLATDVESPILVGNQDSGERDNIFFPQQSPTSETSDEESGSLIFSEEENDGYQGDTDNQNVPAPQHLTSDPSSEKGDEAKRTKKSLVNKRTRFISEAKRSMRMKHCSNLNSKTTSKIV